ncbi:MAG TPA: carbon-nitrogen hydrolase family protein, partial [Armatimonadetes bacterium]|nr:carbon-nitrogen hydrolase family protein [Armatimonadota bacterium]
PCLEITCDISSCTRIIILIIMLLATNTAVRAEGQSHNDTRWSPMKSRLVKISTIQLPGWCEGETPAEIKRNNLQRIERMLAIAGERQSDIVVFGEYSNLRGIKWWERENRHLIDTVPGEITNWLGKIAQRYHMNIVAPIIGICDGKLRNVTLIINRDGELVGEYYKVHLPLPEVKWGVVPGDDIPVFTLDCAKIGIMTCMDIEYPEHALILMLRGAEIIFFPHVQSSWGEVSWEIRYRARAIDTGLYIVSASYGYRPGEWQMGMMLGRSGIVAPDGFILADAGRNVEVLTRIINLGIKRVTNFHFGKLCERTLAVMASRRPELYRDLVVTRFRDEALRRAEAWMAQ